MIATINIIYQGVVYDAGWIEDSDDLNQRVLEECEKIDDGSGDKMIVQIEVYEVRGAGYEYGSNLPDSERWDCGELVTVDEFTRVYDPTAPHLTFAR